MAKITRKLQKIFGADSGAQGVTTYGSPASGTPVYSKDLDAIQTAAWDGGWASAALSGTEIPTFQDFNAIHYATTSQLAYLNQMGVYEWNTAQDYYTGSIVNVAGVLYSAVQDNTGENPTTDDGSNWEQISGTTYVLPNSTTAIVGGVEKATQAEAVAETPNKNITADNAVHIKGVAKAGASFNGKTSVSSINSFGIASIVRNSSGVYTITTTETFDAAIKNVVATAGDSFAVNMIAVFDTAYTATSTTFRIKTIEPSSNVVIDADEVSFAVFGDIS